MLIQAPAAGQMKAHIPSELGSADAKIEIVKCYGRPLIGHENAVNVQEILIGREIPESLCGLRFLMHRLKSEIVKCRVRLWGDHARNSRWQMDPSVLMQRLRVSGDERFANKSGGDTDEDFIEFHGAYLWSRSFQLEATLLVRPTLPAALGQSFLQL